MGGPAYSTQYNRLSHRHFLQQDTWEEPLSFDVEIVSDRVLSEEEVGEVYAWLFHENRFASWNPSPMNTTAFTSTACFTPWRKYKAA